MELNPTFDLSGLSLEQIQADQEQQLQALDTMERNTLNPFPVAAFPEPIQVIINALQDALQYPTDFTGASMLYAASLAIANTHKVQVKSNWQESALIYITPVGAPGTAKSHPQSFALAPIFDKDSKTFKEYEVKRQEYLYLTGLSPKERKEQGLDEPVKPVWQKHLVQDFTPEALTEVHKYNKRGIGVYADELASWFKNFNRYSKGSEQEFWLSNWSGKPIIIDRKTGEPTFIKQPFIPVTGTIQRAVLAELAKDSRSQNGFIDRILFAMPEGLKKTYWSEIDLNPQHRQSWQVILSNLLDLPVNFDATESPIPTVLPYTKEAFALLKEWQRGNTDQCNEAETDAIRGVYSKFEIHVIRLSLILQLLQWSTGESDKQAVGIKAVTGAIELAEYFKQTALKVQQLLSNYTPLDSLPTDKQELYQALPPTFTTAYGVELAAQLEIAERTFKRWLNDKELFEKISTGEYKKKL